MPAPERQSERRVPERAQGRGPRRAAKPALRVMTTTLWEYPSQHYDSAGGDRTQGDRAYVGATPSWVIWQCLMRYTRESDLVVDPMAGSGTTIDVARDLKRRALGYDLAPSREDIIRADARDLPLEAGVADFVFVDPPYSTHVDYSDDPNCIGRLDASPVAENDFGRAYYKAMGGVIAEMHRVLRPKRYAALYVSDSWRKRGRGDAGRGTGVFMPIGFELFAMLRERFTPVDIVCVVRHNQKLQRGNWHKAAEEGNFFLRGFNYLFIVKKEESAGKPERTDKSARAGKPARTEKRR